MRITKQVTTSLLKVMALIVTLYFVSLLGLRIAGFDFAVVMSDSMKPGLERGDLVILKSAVGQNLQMGDVVEYKKGNQSILHRIIGIDSNGLRVKGDANFGPDPLLVQPDHVTSIAVGTLRGFGAPTLWLRNLLKINFAEAQFSDHKSQGSMLKSSIWIDSVAKWKQISGGGTYTFTSPSSVTSSGMGNRTILLTKNKTTDQNFYTSFRLTNKDLSSSTVYLILEACLPASSITCGWVIGISETGKFLVVQTYSSSGMRESPVFTKSYTPNLTVETKIVCHISTSLLQVRINDVQVINLVNPYALAQSKGVTIPSGSYFGFSMINANQFKSSKTLTW